MTTKVSVAAIAFLFALFCCGPIALADLYMSGHGDISLRYENRVLVPHYNLSRTAIVDGQQVGETTPGAGREFAPNQLRVQVASPTFSRPVGTEWDFIGTPANAPIWLLPQSETTGKPYLGLSTDKLNAADWVGGTITWNLTSVNSPPGGNFSLFQTTSFGAPVVFFATSDEITNVDKVTLSPTHAHYNWSFTQEGIYDIRLTASGTHVTGGPTSSTANFQFIVGVPEPSSFALIGIVIAGLFGQAWRVARKRGTNQPCQPTMV